MDISAHIAELLYNHDCVIIPGFGGFVCSYQPAAINSGQNLVYPPGKAVSFNRFLQNNDGLLVNHLAGKKGLSFYEAGEAVNAWVNFSNALLARNDEITLHNIGRFFNDAEGNLQFEPQGTVNYLKSSFGLRILPAAPILRAKETSDGKRRSLPVADRIMALRIAASVLILICMGLLGELMWNNVQIKGLELNQAGVACFVNRLFRTEDKRMEPIPVQAQTGTTVVDVPPSTSVAEPATIKSEVKEKPISPPPVVKEEPVTAVPVTHNKATGSYYIVVGAFKDEQNAENVRKKLLLKFPADNVLFEKHGSLTKVGYLAANDITIAKQQLSAAQSEDSSYWILRK